MLCFAENRMHDQPFDMYYCNAKMDGTTMKQLQRYIPTMCEPWFPLNVHTESYMDIFPKENLVYLTPHCRNDLMEYNPDDVYIVGAMVDKVR
jgi:mitochondrial ribonuclease P protein 1